MIRLVAACLRDRSKVWSNCRVAAFELNYRGGGPAIDWNPYQAPLSEVSDHQHAHGDETFLGQPRSRDAGAGIRWLERGWVLFTANPGIWIIFAILIFGVWLVSLFVPLSGFVAFMLLSPILLGGVMMGCHSLHDGGALEFEHLFAGFGDRVGSLLILGVLYLVSAVILMGLIMFPAFGVLGLSQLGDHAEVPALWAGGLALIILLFVAILAVPVTAIFWFATPLIAINDIAPIEAMKLSFLGCVKNIAPFLLYGLIGLVIAIVATLPLALGWVIAAPVFMASIYTGYRDIYYES